MNRKILARSIAVLLGLAGLIGAASTASAAGHTATVSRQVSTAGLDLNRPEDARELYRRLRVAAKVVCGHGNRIDLVPEVNPAQCEEQALGDVIRRARLPPLTLVYLSMHSIDEAVARGIELPPEMASR